MGSRYLSVSEDRELPSHCLPPGGKPDWVEMTHLVRETEVLEYIKTIITEGHSVTVMHGRDKNDSETRAWCFNQGWGYKDGGEMIGSEDQVVICIGDDCVFLNECVSRARNQLILVTNRGR